ncbi:MAG: GTPase Era [Candidatus Omnitrophica bacterium]|nr:GTPase Era [Candidatus Omnitrophota bacterium]
MEKNKSFKSGYVALMGKPNVGKSTLLNYFLAEKLSIISDKPQTTRDAILGILSDEQSQIIFVDTPGVHKPLTNLGQCMVRSALGAVEDADIVILIIDAESGITKADQHIFKTLKEKKIADNCRWAAVLINKIDLIPKENILALLDACSRQISFDDYIPVSGKTGENCALVLEKIKEKLPEGPEYFPNDQLTDKNERFVVAELIREQVLCLCREEIPHSVAVEVHKFADNPGRKTLIQATIFLERDAQKKIVIGSQGKMLKNIGSAARTNIEEFIGRKVYLELWVKVQDNWRKDESFLRRLGYEK